MSNQEYKQCLECGWSGDILECDTDKQWSEWGGGGYVAVPLCPICKSEHISNYDSQEAKDSRMMFTGEE